MLATEFKERLEQMAGGQVEVTVLENDDVLIRPAIDWNRVPDFVRNVFLEYLGIVENGR
ncbi:MAG: hypothetical protein MR804_08915 [Limosilactobacillus reuteri]|nr:hypothetical protein [Limosilactobacillus reuteri]MDY4730331.1 hypothetical protein [Lactobacillus amylovorus]